MRRKIIIAVLSTLVYGLILGGIQPLSSYSIQTHIFNALFFMMFIAPALFILGIPISYLIDRITNKKTLQLIAYILFGLLAGIIAFLIISIGGSQSFTQFFEQITSYTLIQFLQFGLFGLGGSVLFFIVSLSLDSFKEKQNKIHA